MPNSNGIAFYRLVRPTARVALLATLLASASITVVLAQERWLDPAQPPDGIAPQLLSPPDIPNFQPTQAEQSPAGGIQNFSFRLPGYVFRPSNSLAGYAPSSGCIYATSNAHINFTHLLQLPQGAEIKTLRMYFYDTSADYNNIAWLMVHDLYGDAPLFWQVTSTGNFGYSFNDSAPINHVVDYNLYSYSLIWRPVLASDSLRLCGFRIFYEVAGPLIFDDRFELG